MMVLKYEGSYGSVTFFLISKKRILLIKEKQEKHKEFTVVNKGKTKQQDKKQPLNYSNRRNKIRKGRTIRETPTTRPIKEGPLAKL